MDHPEQDERIVCDPDVMVGKPVIRGTRITVEHVLWLLSEGWSVAEMLENYPHITAEDVAACLRYAHRLLQEQRVFPTAA